MGLMAHEEQSIGGSKLSKKLKHKKVPQRGMGVAQLEKIILEERQLKDPNLTLNSIKFRRPIPANRNPWILESDGVVNAELLSNSLSRFYKFDGENLNQIQNRYMVAMPANQGGFGYVSNSSNWPPQFSAQRLQFQQSCSSSMVNVTSGTTSSTVMNTQIEPPSNQSLCGNNYPSFMPDGNKMVGLKRSYPFSMENMPIPSFNCNVPSAYVPLVSNSGESTSCTSGGTGTTNLELNVPLCRENPSSLGLIRDQKTKKFIDENLDLNKDFLTLAPPQSIASSHPSLHETLPSYQGQTRDSSETEWSNQHPLHSFFPAAKIEGNSNDEVGEHVDLSLKL